MIELAYDELVEKLKSGKIRYDQIYNLDNEIAQYHAFKYYIDNPDDNVNVDQQINTLFFDIEVYNHNRDLFKDKGMVKAVGEISSVTIYSNFEKIYHIFFLVLPMVAHLITNDMISDIEKAAYKRLVAEKYIDEDDKIKINLFSNELKLIEQQWSKVHELDPSVLSGFNADGFDMPYIYNRLNILYNGDEGRTAKTLSKFGCIKKRRTPNGFMINIGEYPLLDIQYMYKPRDEGGLIASSH